MLAGALEALSRGRRVPDQDPGKVYLRRSHSESIEGLTNLDEQP